MTTSFDCALDGVALSSLDGRICVLDIIETPRMNPPTFSGERRHLLDEPRDGLDVEIRFAIQEEDPALRREALQKALAWSVAGNHLTTSDRPGLILIVACTNQPAMAAEDWTAPLTLTFTATRCPYWETLVTAQAIGSGVMTLEVPGTADASPVEVTVANTGTETITRLSLVCGATYMIFEGIHLPVGGEFLMQMENGFLTARVDGQSVLASRTPGSSDLLLALCSQPCAVCATADTPVTATFMARGRYA